MKIYTDKNIEECKKILLQNIRACKISPSLYTSITYLNDEIVGNVHKNSFWLEYTKPQYWRGISRVFKGKFIIRDYGTEIEGRFHFHMIHKIIWLFSILYVVKDSVLDTIDYREINIAAILINSFPIIVFLLFC